MMGWEYDGVQLNTGVSRALDQYEWRTPLPRQSKAAVKPFWLGRCTLLQTSIDFPDDLTL
jgi:hypothetical protein